MRIAGGFVVVEEVCSWSESEVVSAASQPVAAGARGSGIGEREVGDGRSAGLYLAEAEAGLGLG